MQVNYKMMFKSEKDIIESLKVDDVNDGLIIKTEFEDNNLKFEINTNKIGSLKNILDDFFVNYELAEKVVNIKK